MDRNNNQATDLRLPQVQAVPPIPAPQAPVAAPPHAYQTIPMTQAAMIPASADVPTVLNQPPVVGKSVARRKFMGKSLVGLVAAGGAVAVGGVALSEWLSHGGLNALTHGPAASEVQTGHLLRRAGFGATASELSTYRNLGYQGAVDRLLNYQQVDDSEMEKRLQALNLNMNAIQDQQRWWLLRMAWTQRPLLEKMTLFWSGVLTSSFRKVGGPRAFIRILNQNNFYIDLLLVRGTVTRQAQPQIDLQNMIDANQLGSPEECVDHFSGFLLDGPLPTECRNQILDYFTATNNASRARITLAGGKAYPLNRVRGALYLMMASPEYQLNARGRKAMLRFAEASTLRLK